MARIVHAVIGSFGDLHPHLALGLALKAAGHDVAVATLPVYRDKVLATGLAHYPLRPAIDYGDKALLARILDPRRGPEWLVRDWLMAHLRETYTDLAVAAADADLLISSDVVFAAPILAEATDLRWASIALSPLTYLSVHDPPAIPLLRGLSRLGWLGPPVLRQLVGLAHRITEPWGAAARELRRELGLPPGRHPILGAQHSPQLDLAAFSPLLARLQPDWPSATQQVGYLWYDRWHHDQGLSDQVSSFLAAGEPPVVFTLGSAAVFLAADFYRESLAAAQAAGVRAILLTGPEEANQPRPVPPEVLLCEYAPYSELFGRVAAVVHSGGAGTTAQTLRAGRPSLVVPYAHDQFDNASRVERLGAGRSVVRRRYTAARAAREIRRLLDQPGYTRQAGVAAQVLAAEDGLGAARAAIERLLALPRPGRLQ